MSSGPAFEVVDVTDMATFALLPPCADARFDHRSCDYWEDEARGSKAARRSWWQTAAKAAPPPPRPVTDNPFAPTGADEPIFNPFATSSDGPDVHDNPFAPERAVEAGALGRDAPRKLHLLERGRAVFGSYAKLLLLDGRALAYAQFGPLSAYPRAQQIRELYPRLPQTPLPAVITCVATTTAARGQGHGRTLVEAVCTELTRRGFAAVEAYPDLTLGVDEASAAHPGFWKRCGFALAAEDERYPVLRRELD